MAKRKNNITDQIRALMVTRLACYDSPTEIAQDINEQTGLDLTKQNVQRYDPTTMAGKQCAKRWRTLFKEVRDKFHEDASEYVPISSKSVRLRELQKQFDLSKSRKNQVMALRVLEQTAKETGGHFTNRREITGKDGGAIKSEVEATVESMTETEVDQELMAIFAKLASMATPAQGKQDAE